MASKMKAKSSKTLVILVMVFVLGFALLQFSQLDVFNGQVYDCCLDCQPSPGSSCWSWSSIIFVVGIILDSFVFLLLIWELSK